MMNQGTQQIRQGEAAKRPSLEELEITHSLFGRISFHDNYAIY